MQISYPGDDRRRGALDERPASGDNHVFPIVDSRLTPDQRTHVVPRRAVYQLARVTLVVAFPLAAIAADNSPNKRARPPQQWPDEVRELFVENPRDLLVGPRPDYEGPPMAERRDEVPPPSAHAPFPWTELIDAETIETEIKRIAAAASQDVSSPGRFKSQGYKNCRQRFTVVAALLGAIAEYDGSVRWKDAAPALRDAFARAARRCKVGTDQTFEEARARVQDLVDLVRGSRPAAPESEPITSWAAVADRPPLMQRLETAHEARLKDWLATERQFRRQADEIRHEAQLVATIAEIIGREGFDYWDDEQYAEYARALRQAARDLASAVELENYERAREAIDRATKSCTECHESYRG